MGLFLGHGRGAEFGDRAWSSQEEATIESCVRSGLRQFYFPPAVDGGSSYDWSFLKPTAALTFPEGQNILALPDDFGGLEGRITLSTTNSQLSWPIPFVGEGKVREMFSAFPDATGRPEWASLQPLKGTAAQRGQRWQLYIYPTADQDYTLEFTYYVLPDCLSGSYPHTYGGMPHAETILESCLAIAEQRVDDSSAVHSMKFQERLQASVSHDRRLKPQLLGYNGDRSDGRRWLGRRDLHWQSSVTFNGVTPG